MTKKEIIWRQILHEATTKKTAKFTQKELADKFKFSLSTIFNALSTPRKIGAVEVTGRFFRVRDAEKLLYLWATHRNLKKDIVYASHTDLSAQKTENSMPADVIFGGFSAFRLKYKDAPADYDLVFIYAGDAAEIKKRFPPQKGRQNIIVLKPDPHLAGFGPMTPDVQTFADLWNVSEWYAKDFLNALKEKMNL